MGVELIDSHMIQKFVDNSEAFEKCIEEQFNALDANKDGVLSREEIQNETNMELALQSKEEIDSLYDVLFEKFGVEKKGTFNRKEFGSMMKEVMLARVNGFGETPISIILQEDSLLQKAV
ncbi:uncharacterized protein LOC143612761 [Bidens hawaiensis]|uniref:uncharacterized protein LOC143612761 n=1 Tax=Bidens hawaiensis TaxID=980011 RepID=UPI00404A070F